MASAGEKKRRGIRLEMMMKECLCDGRLQACIAIEASETWAALGSIKIDEGTGALSMVVL